MARLFANYDNELNNNDMEESRYPMLRTPFMLVSCLTRSVSALGLVLVLSACGSDNTDETGGAPSTSSGSSNSGGGVGGAVIVPPSTPDSTTLRWSPNTEPDLAGYRVYYGTEPRQYFQAKGQGVVVVGNSYTVTGLASGVRYYFAVTAFDEASNESDYSAERFKDIP